MRFWPKKRRKQILIVSIIVLIVVILAAILYVGFVNREPAFKANAPAASLVLTSTAFENGATIPQRYTGQGENINPPLNVTGLPNGTASIAIIVEDPIFASVTWDHWIIWNIPPSEPIDENTTLGVQGKNGWGENKYGGPNPPFGTRSYHFKVYALDTTLNFPAGAIKSDVLRAMDNHMLAKAELIGKYR